MAIPFISASAFPYIYSQKNQHNQKQISINYQSLLKNLNYLCLYRKNGKSMETSAFGQIALKYIPPADLSIANIDIQYVTYNFETM